MFSHTMPVFSSHHAKAEELFQQRKLTEAFSLSLKALQELASFPYEKTHVHLLLSKILITQGKYLGQNQLIKSALPYIEKATQEADQLLDIELQLTCTWVMAQAQLSLGQEKEAARLFQLLLDSAQSHFPSLVVYALLGLSQVALLANDYHKGADFAQQAESAFAQLTPATQASLFLVVHNQLSQVHLKLQNYEKMAFHSTQVLERNEEEGNAELVCNCLKNKAIYHAYQSEYKEAMQFFLSSLKKSRAIEYKTHTAQCLINIATIYANLYNHKDAIDRYQVVLNDYNDVISEETRSAIYNNLGNIFYYSHKPQIALEFYLQSMDLAKAKNNTKMQLLTLANLSKNYIAVEEIDKATQCAEEAEAIRQQTNFKDALHINLLNLGHIAYLQKDYPNALEKIQQGIQIAQQLHDSSHEIRGHNLLANIHEELGDFKTALFYQKQYGALQYNFNKKRKNNQILDLEIKNAIKEKQNEIERLTKENELQTLLLEQSKKIATQNEKLVAANEELKQFAYIVSHDLKEPIRMIGSYTQLIERKHQEVFDENSISYFKYVKEGVLRMNALLDALLRYTTINRSSDKFEKVALNDIVDIAILHLRVRIEENKAIIDRHDLPEIYSIKSLLIQLFQNLIGNAIKFKKDSIPPKISIESHDTASEIIIEVKDNGIGIPKDFQEQIFVIFQRLHHRHSYEGTGIGLAICQKIAKRLGARIWLNSEEAKGSSFYIGFPKKKVGAKASTDIPPTLST